MSVIEGLFGLGDLRQGVEQNLRRQDLNLGNLIGQATANQYADPRRQQAYVDQQSAMGALGGMAARGIGGLFGIEDPQLQRASSLEGILQSTQQELGADANDPTKFYPALQQKLSAGGFQREAAQVMDASSKLIGDLGVSQATRQAQLATAQEKRSQSELNTAKALKEGLPELTGIEKLLAARERAEKAGKPTTAIDNTIAKESQATLPGIDQKIVELAAKKAKSGLTPSEDAELDYLDNFKTRVATASANKSVVQVATGKAEDEFAKFAGKTGAERQFGLYDNATKAIGNLSKIDDTIRLLETGNVRTGFGADIIKNIDRAVATFGGKKAAKSASDTELLNALLGSEVFPLIGTLDIGARGLDTVAEREFLREVMTGTITLNKDTLIRMAEMRKKLETGSLDTYNSAVDSGELDAFFEYSKVPKQKLGVTGTNPKANTATSGRTSAGTSYRVLESK